MVRGGGPLADIQMTLGGIFQQNALFPIRAAEQMLRRQQIAEMLNAVCADRLAATLANGTKAVARAAGVGEQMVNGILPVTYGTELLDRVAISQQGAIEVWNHHQSSLAELLQGFLGGFGRGLPGHRGLGRRNFLSQLAGGFARDARFRGPMQELVQLLTDYEQYVHHCAALLDVNVELGGHGVRPGVGQRSAGWPRCSPLSRSASGCGATSCVTRSRRPPKRQVYRARRRARHHRPSFPCSAGGEATAATSSRRPRRPAPT